MPATETGPPVRELPAQEVLVRARALIEPVLQVSVDSLGDALRRMAGYHLGWWDAAGTPTPGASGKALRPALTLTAATVCGGDAAEAVPAAAAVELLHNFSLVHDDVMDEDPLRRGRRTVWSVWGVTNAILLGDAFHALSVGVLSTRLPGHVTAEAITWLQKTALELCRGQYDDCAFENRPQVGIDDYIAMAMGKTGALMGCACALGALCVGADTATISDMDFFGRELGLAFQFVDDVIGICGDPAVSGKPVGSDLRSRKKTLPVVAALESGTDAAVELAALYRSTEPLTSDQVERAADLVHQAGGLDLALHCARHRLTAAMQVLPAHATAEDLQQLARLVTLRDR
ncbi:polyprenyl synthetase family protein [Nocardia sp. NPDC049190]|uniref:polyprenyl synthetase family protein n=1 Tax=Nocardia sp. NPDC049190 TaxID=3155650 RepID=UPI0033F1FE01